MQPQIDMRRPWPSMYIAPPLPPLPPGALPLARLASKWLLTATIDEPSAPIAPPLAPTLPRNVLRTTVVVPTPIP
jgi:hypothetical protein